MVLPLVSSVSVYVAFLCGYSKKINLNVAFILFLLDGTALDYLQQTMTSKLCGEH